MHRFNILRSPLDKEQILIWLREEDPSRLELLWNAANQTRQKYVGDEVHLRGLVEISNYCRRQCAYCGIRAGNRTIERYRMTHDEVLDCSRKALSYGYGTVVLQAGEDPGLERAWVFALIEAIKKQTGLAVTLSLGERSFEELKAWKEAGADRYLLRFETSDPELYAQIHPSLPHSLSDRIALLETLRELDYEIGSGIMVGFPGQTWETLADDLLTFAKLDLDMIGVGPFIPHPDTPMGIALEASEVPATEDVVYRVVALTRLVCPEANIPSTTALATINKESGRELGLLRGANIVMPNVTPVRYRTKYEIYPGKACINETAQACQGCLAGRIASIGRVVGQGPGGRQRISQGT